MVEMEINRVLAQMRALSAELSPRPQSRPLDSVDFGAVLKDAIGKVNDSTQAADKLVTEFEMGTGNVSVAEVMVATQKASLSFQAMNEVRNRLIDAYHEVMNMPI